MITLDQILNEREDCSSLSAEESFTLEDILLEPDELLDDVNEEDINGMFDDEDEQQQTAAIQKAIQRQTSKVFNLKQLALANKLVQQEKPQKKIINRQSRLKDYQLPGLKDVKNMSFVVLKNVTALFENPESNGVGIPTVISAKGGKYLAVGTSIGNIAVFTVGAKGYKLLGSTEHKKFGQITSIAISNDNKYLVGGQDSGMLTVWDLYYLTQLKKQLVSRCKIIKIIFCSQNQFVLNDIQGSIYLYTIQKYIWVNLKSQRFFQKTDAYYYDIKSHKLRSNIQVIALCTLDNVLVLTYKPQVLPIARFSRPEDLYYSKLPNIELGRCAIFSVSSKQHKQQSYNDVLCISWSKTIFLYKFLDEQGTQRLQLIYRFEQQSPIYNMQFISDGILVTLDNKQTFRSYRIWINNGGGHILINEKEVPQQIIYQRFLKDKNNKYIKSFNNTIVNCHFSQKDKELFFICKNSIYRCRIHRWNQTISQLINNEREFLKALKICLELFNNRMNIFLEPIEMTEKTIKVFCQIGRLYLSQKLKEIQKINENRVQNIDQMHSIKLVQQQVQETYECLIQYMISINSQNFLFQKLYRDVIKQRHYSDEYHYKFLDCLQPFINNGTLTRISSLQLFKQITDYFLKQGKKALVDNLIMSLEIESIFYSEAIEICTKNKLYRALAYVCETHGQYIPPLNKLLQQIMFAQRSGLSQAQQIYYMIFKDYTIKLLACIYINGNSFTENPSTMKKSLSTWLTCKETFTFFAKNKEQTYQKDYFYFLEGMIQSLNEESQSKQYIHSILKQLITQKHSQREIAQLFIKLSSTINLDISEIQIIIQYSSLDLITKHLTQFLHFINLYIKIIDKIKNFDKFIDQNKHLAYFYYLVSKDKAKTALLIDYVASSYEQNSSLNFELTKYILANLTSQQVAENIEDLLKIHSENMMVYMLQKFSLEIVNQRLMSIKDTEYRYLVIRKLLKKLRKEQNSKKKKAKKVNPQSKISVPSLIQVNQDSQSSVLSQSQGEKQENPARKKLGKEVLQFYIKCLCQYKKQKRVYYEFISYLSDYSDNLDAIIKIIQPFKFSSSLGLLEQNKNNYQKAYSYFEQVYNYYFFEQNYKKLIKVIHCHGRFMRRIFERMLVITQILNTEKQWIQLLTCVISPLQATYDGKKVCDGIQAIYQKKSTHPFLQQLSDILELCLTNVSNKVPISVISEFIGKHSYIFIKKFVLNSFRSTLLTYSKNAYIFLLANQMIINDQIVEFDKIYEHKILGVTPNILCEQCQRQFQPGQTVKIYSCNHSYHQQCHVDPARHESSVNSQGQEQISTGKDRCKKCIILSAGQGQFAIKPQIPDFNITEQNILYKGMKGIVNIIPSMISVIPNPINVFTSSAPQIIAPEQIQKQQKFDDDQVYDYLAFEKTIELKQDEFDVFLKEYQAYFDQN